MASLRNEIRKLAKHITRVYEKEIKRKDLIDTGKLINSFKTKISVKRDGSVDIEVKSMYYLKYLDIPFEVSEDIYKSKDWLKIEDKLVGLITENLFIDVPKEFKASESVEYQFNFKSLKTKNI